METLAQRIKRDGQLNELDAVGWAIRLARRLELLHALGVFHGSISPSCIVTAGAERTAMGRLADLRATTSDLGYQSPEQISGGRLSAADDAWAVVATLYALLTGTPPFTGLTDDETRQRIFQASPSPLAVYDVGDDDLQHIIDSGFAREIGQRTIKVAALRASLEQWHPDPKVKTLAPLEDDEESTSGGNDDEDEGGRTMLRASPFDGDGPPPASFGSTAKLEPKGPPRPQLPTAPLDVRPPGVAPLLGREGMVQPLEDEDEENARTMLRDLAPDIAEKARAAMNRAAPAAGALPVPMPPPPPSAPRANAMFAGSAAGPNEPGSVAALLAQGAERVRRPAADDDDDDLQATVMREAPVFPPGFGGGPPPPSGPWRPGPAAGGPAAGGPTGAFPIPAPPPSSSHGAQLQGGNASPSSQRGPQGGGDFTQAFPAAAWPLSSTVHMNQAPQVQPAPGSHPGVPQPAWASQTMQQHLQSGGNPFAYTGGGGGLPQGMIPLAAPQGVVAPPAKGRGMTVLAIVALILTAAATFAVVRYGGFWG